MSGYHEGEPMPGKGRPPTRLHHIVRDDAHTDEVAGGWTKRRRDGWVTLTVYAVILFAAIVMSHALALDRNAHEATAAYAVADKWHAAYNERTDQLAGQLDIGRDGVLACLVTHAEGPK